MCGHRGLFCDDTDIVVLFWRNRVKTPGGKLTVHYIKKRGKAPKCGDTGHRLHGIAAVRSKELKNMSKSQKSVSRAYGGCLSAKAVRSR